MKQERSSEAIQSEIEALEKEREELGEQRQKAEKDFEQLTGKRKHWALRALGKKDPKAASELGALTEKAVSRELEQENYRFAIAECEEKLSGLRSELVGAKAEEAKVQRLAVASDRVELALEIRDAILALRKKLETATEMDALLDELTAAAGEVHREFRASGNHLSSLFMAQELREILPRISWPWSGEQRIELVESAKRLLSGAGALEIGEPEQKAS